eukprot:19090-Heterococcus_DN1.PRE.1
MAHALILQVLCTCTNCRFATGSKNRVEELHPHEWVQFCNEDVWMLWEGAFQCVKGVKVGIHITHNGDFEAMEAFGTMYITSSKLAIVCTAAYSAAARAATATNEELGMWLERVLHSPNDCKGDSPKYSTAAAATQLNHHCHC